MHFLSLSRLLLLKKSSNHEALHEEHEENQDKLTKFFNFKGLLTYPSSPFVPSWLIAFDFESIKRARRKPRQINKVFNFQGF